ncbi:MAG: thioredoxin domain-containing protein [Myxococcales bacterium]|nr:thioredoxin domain-containing protein [Myxococcales bacterium]
MFQRWLRGTPAALLLCAATCIAPLACAHQTPERSAPGSAAAHDTQPDFREWTPEAFADARAEGRLILVSVQAGWCHWCHVMNEVTFADPRVLALLAEHYVVIRVEADARPDLAERYAEYGWPATALLTPDAQPILALRGYRAPDVFASILARAADDVAAGRVSSADALAALEARTPAGIDEALSFTRAQLDRMYEPTLGGWGRRQRYPFAAPLLHAFSRAVIDGDEVWGERALLTARSYAQLLDPVFGGMYQYSTQGDWEHPHYEKIAAIQAGAIQVFVAAYAASGDERWLERACSVGDYVRAFLEAPDGGYYASQDADVPTTRGVLPGAEYYALSGVERRALGLPRTDTHVYGSLNGLLIDAMARLSEVDPQGPWLASATAAATRVVRTHRRGAAFAHAAEDPADGLLYLADQAYMARGLATLGEASGDARWFALAAETLAFSEAQLRDQARGGFYAHTPDPHAVGVFATRQKPLEQNAVLAEVMLELAQRSDDAARRERALAALQDVAAPGSVARHGRKVGALLLALERARSGYFLLSVVGEPDDPATRELHAAALLLQRPDRLVELGVPGSSRYPYPGAAAVYLCSHEACSMPLQTPAQLPEGVGRFAAALRAGAP